MFEPLLRIGRVVGKSTNDQGMNLATTVKKSLHECKHECSKKSKCNSFTYCSNLDCHLKDLDLTGNEASREYLNVDGVTCTSYFHSCMKGYYPAIP